MELVVKGNAKEIASLVLGLQGKNARGAKKPSGYDSGRSCREKLVSKKVKR